MVAHREGEKICIIFKKRVDVFLESFIFLSTLDRLDCHISKALGKNITFWKDKINSIHHLSPQSTKTCIILDVFERLWSEASYISR